MPPARAAKRSDGFVGLCWKRSRRLHYRLWRQRLKSDGTRYVGRWTANESAQGAYESKKHDEFFHFESPLFPMRPLKLRRFAISKGGSLRSSSDVPFLGIDLATE